MADLDSLINSKITLISHQDIRYDGTLFSINTAESSIVLKDVKIVGTEDRVTDPTKKVMPNPRIAPFVTFPGKDIKDLFVHENQETTSAPEPALPTPPPAQTSSKPSSYSGAAKGEIMPAKPLAAQRPGKPSSKPSHNNAQKENSYSKKENNNDTNTNTNKSNKPASNENKGGNVGTGAHLLRMRERRGGADGKPEEVAGEFDFQTGLSIFNKSEVMAKVATDASATQSNNGGKYEKDDFFDTLSCDITERQEGRSTRLTYQQERSLNQDTFGAIALQGRFGRGGRGLGGRGRGGRGRGGGRGRYQGGETAN